MPNFPRSTKIFQVSFAVMLSSAIFLIGLPLSALAATSIVQIPGVPLFDQRTQLRSCDRTGVPDNVGCALTAVAMVLSYYGMPATPEKVYAANHSDDCAVVWGGIKYSDIMPNPPAIQFLNLDADSDYASITAQIRQGHPLIVGGHQLLGRGQHYVVIVGYVDGNYIINDPWGGRQYAFPASQMHIEQVRTYIGPKVNAPVVGNFAYNVRVFAADIDGKNGSDIIGLGLNGEIYYTLSNGDGTFGKETKSTSHAFSPAAGWFRTDIHNRVFVADINGDKRMDLLGLGDKGEIYYALSNGDGTFTKETKSTSHAFSPTAGWFKTDIQPRVFVADINGDGRDDLLGIGDLGNIYYALSNGDGTFSKETESTSHAFSPKAGWFTTDIQPRVFVADINGDGRDDLLGIGDLGEIYYALSNGDGTFAKETLSPDHAFSPKAGWFRTNIQSRVFVADVNKDGKQELMGIGDDGKIYYALSNGNGTFGNETYSGRKVLPPNSGWFINDIHRRVFAADFTGDGATDLLGIGNTGQYYYSLSGGDGTFGKETNVGNHGFSPSSGWFI